MLTVFNILKEKQEDIFRFILQFYNELQPINSRTEKTAIELKQHIVK